ncbi:PIG-L family deacetylase [Opitutus sp. GAS368]|uniref:PIG-L deacetylase family protein n=1 Tax=Opitutus sp. GAS368 TaxID=1882749 RepID=UPI00087D0706|nr:PIG-L family deacetylase [Opitutus sp. GAS368]SDS64097.1 N-acetylglucosaminyl deacetylase, LmbE family [Opitutus sp. GAS368]
MKNVLRRVLGVGLAWLLRLRSQPYPFPPGVALVLAPHADDETLGCGGLLALKQARGDAVRVVFVTDSAGSPAVPGLSARRRDEALAALATLGLAHDCAHFLGAPDGRLNSLAPAEGARLTAALAALLAKLQPAEVFVPYLGGGSSEHDATVQLARVALASAGMSPRVWEYPVWAWWNPARLAGQLAQPAQNFHLKLGAVRARKRAALTCHASQCAGRPPALPSVLAALCTGPVEFYFHRQP